MPIVTIYLLGYDLGLSDEAVLDVCRALRRGALAPRSTPAIRSSRASTTEATSYRSRGCGGGGATSSSGSIFDQGEARIEQGGAQVLRTVINIKLSASPGNQFVIPVPVKVIAHQADRVHLRLGHLHARRIGIRVQRGVHSQAGRRPRVADRSTIVSKVVSGVPASSRREAVPIVTIYLLGYDLGLSDEAVLDVCPRATARRTGAEIDEITGHPFIAGIHHRSHIVQIPRLRGRRRDAARMPGWSS